MKAHGKGNATPEKREGRARLSVRDPRIETLLAGIEVDGSDLDGLRLFAKRCWSARNQWDLSRRLSDDANAWFAAGGFKSWWNRADAERAYRTAFAKGVT